MPKPLFISVNGTGVPDPFGPGFPADIGRELANPWNDVMAQFWGPQFANRFEWQPIGYRADVFPMRGSVQNSGRPAVLEQIQRRPRGTPLVLSGYSQGAIVTNYVWRDDILNPRGVLNDRLEDVKAIINFGDPMRCPGIANGNAYARTPLPAKLNGHTTGGIAGADCLTADETPDFLLSFANDGDLYAAAPVGDDPWSSPTKVGSYQTLIYEMVMDFDGRDILAFARAAAKLVAEPLTSVLPLIQAIWGGLAFAVQGPRAPHWTYDIRPAVQYLNELADKLELAA